MELKQYFAEQLKRETATSRKAIERFPEGRNAWKPHTKSMELGYLAALVAGMPGWVAMMIDHDSIDLGGNGANFRTVPVEMREDLLAILDKGLAASLRALENTTDEHLMKTWKLTWGDKVLVDESRYAAIADGCLSHMAHHRGQLTVYLRLNDSIVPALYGPSADEGQ